MACVLGTPLPSGLYQNLPLPGPGPTFNFIGAGFNFILGGVGTRDIDTNTTPATINITVPPGSTIIHAYLYVNTLAANTVGLPTVNFNNGTGAVDLTAAPPYNLGLIGWCNDTCWLAVNDGSNQDGATTQQNIFNQIYWADVTSLALVGTNTYTIKLPGITTATGPGSIATLASDTPHYPTCAGSQGIALLVVYNDGSGIMRNVQIFQGAVLLTPSGEIFGGAANYLLTFPAGAYTQNAKIGLAVGDAQTTYSDTFSFNGAFLPENMYNSAINPNNGNLLFTTNTSGACGLSSNTAYMNVAEGNECIDWFLFVYQGDQASPCTVPDCGPNSCHGAAPFDELYYFNTFTGGVDFVLAGAGIRDFDTNITPAIINVNIPGPVIKAYLYWNTLGGGDCCANTAILNGHSVSGNIIGCCGNTCWSAFCVSGGSDHTDTNQNIINKVWWQDVTAFVTGTGSYNISIPGVKPDSAIAYAASDSPHYPGCCGGQGVALLVVYEINIPTTTRPVMKCPPPGQAGCIPTGKTVTQSSTNQIIIYHGAKLLIPTGGMPPTIGGSPEYSVAFKTKYTWNPRIATGVGDAQSTYSDFLSWNGLLLPGNNNFSYFDNSSGNLLSAKTFYLPAHSAVCDCGGGQMNIATASTPDDCLSWFLFVYFGSQVCTKPIVTKKSSNIAISPPTPRMTLWNPNPPDCLLKVPCCKDICLPTTINVGITGTTLACACLANQGYTMEWNANEQKYLMNPYDGICGCTLFGWLYCVDNAWRLYLALENGSTVCADGINTDFLIQCSPFGGVGTLVITPTGDCSCDCNTDTLTVSFSPG